MPLVNKKERVAHISDALQFFREAQKKQPVDLSVLFALRLAIFGPQQTIFREIFHFLGCADRDGSKLKAWMTIFWDRKMTSN